MIATLDWAIPHDILKSIVESRTIGQMELKGRLRGLETIWFDVKTCMLFDCILFSCVSSGFWAWSMMALFNWLSTVRQPPNAVFRRFTTIWGSEEPLTSHTYAGKVNVDDRLSSEKDRWRNQNLCSNQTGPLFSLSKGPRQFYSYGTLNLLTIPVPAFQYDCCRHLLPQNSLLISFKLYTFIDLEDENDFDEIKLYRSPTNEALMNDLNHLLKEPKFSDVTINCSGEILKAHKCILAG